MAIKDLIPYKPALELKKLGFREPCFGNYKETEIIDYNLGRHNKHIFLDTINGLQDYNEHNKETDASAPTFIAAFRFFREKFDWQFSVEATSDQHNRELGYNYWIWNHKTGEEYHTMPKNRPSGDWEYETYEEADLAGLNKLIELTKIIKL